MIGLLATLWGCGDASRVQDLELQLESANREIERLQQQLEEQAVDHEASREARRQELQERLRQRRAERDALDGEDGEVAPAPWTGPDTVRAALQSEDPLEDGAKLGRFLLHRDPEGVYDGYRVSAVRRGSLLDRAGVKNGDIIHAVGGNPVTSMEEAMQAYTALKNHPAATVDLDVTRRGEKVVVTIALDAPLAEMDGPPADE